ncbi:MAG TPA: alpha/beta hydrolase fold domain-containing protein [Acidimicrobiales bacterium]|nr:alpha/beta hydrolase fold domain-containing protein [Acidimicrobiales bacterium]
MSPAGWDLPPERGGRDATEALQARRAGVGATAAAAPPGVASTHMAVGGVPCIVLTPPDWRCELVYLHGGGYRMGQPAGWAPLASRLMAAIGARATLVDYRLAPEHPFPAAVHDAAAVYAALRAAGDRPIVVAGDSAGGGLAASLAVAALRNGVSPPDALVLLSPWLDVALTGATHATHATRDLLFPPASSAEAAETYLQGHPARDPLASPLFADVEGFPPTMLFAGTEETLLADSLSFASRLALSGVTVTLHVAAGMQHVWPLLQPDTRESHAVFAAIAAFAGPVLGQVP